MKDVIKAIENDYFFFIYFFKDFSVSKNLVIRNSEIFLSIKRYTKKQILFNRFKILDNKNEAKKMREIRHKSRYYYITHSNKLRKKRINNVSYRYLRYVYTRIQTHISIFVRIKIISTNSIYRNN